MIIMGVILFGWMQDTTACSRFVYVGPNNTIITARSMDWKWDIMTNLYVFPAGMERDGAMGSNSIKWKSKYGSVIASAYEMCSSDGMNEKGLVASVLWLDESVYPTRGTKPELSIGAWVQYALDNFSTVEEAVKELSAEKFNVVSFYVPNTDVFATVHLALSDATGDNAIFEYVNGKLVVHHSKDYTVMTNSPVYEKQLALTDYWKEVNGLEALPGTHRSEDRFIRATYYLSAIKKSDDIKEALSSAFSIIRNISVPAGISTTDKPNLSRTRWVTVYDQKNKIMYFEKTNTPSIMWVDFKDIGLIEKSEVKKLPLLNDEYYSGNCAKNFVVTEPFKFVSSNK